MEMLLPRTKDFLRRAREKYGYKNQISICMEELNELAAVLPKYIRYDYHEEAVNGMREKVIDECADVLNAIDHIQEIFGITDEDLVLRSAKKMDRVAGWLIKGGKKVTLEERDIPDKPCPLCKFNGGDPFAMPCWYCNTHQDYGGFTLSDS